MLLLASLSRPLGEGRLCESTWKGIRKKFEKTRHSKGPTTHWWIGFMGDLELNANWSVIRSRGHHLAAHGPNWGASHILAYKVLFKYSVMDNNILWVITTYKVRENNRTKPFLCTHRPSSALIHSKAIFPSWFWNKSQKSYLFCKYFNVILKGKDSLSNNSNTILTPKMCNQRSNFPNGLNDFLHCYRCSN